MIRWSCNATPSGAAAFLISLVTAMSALDGVGSPEGWLCTITILTPMAAAGLLAISWFGWDIRVLSVSPYLPRDPANSPLLITPCLPPRSGPCRLHGKRNVGG